MTARRSAALGIAAIALLAVGLVAALVPSGVALPSHPAAAPTRTDAVLGTPQQWTSGTRSSSSSTVTEFEYAVSYVAASVSTFDVVATNTSATTVQLETIESATSSENISACAPDCLVPTSTIQFDLSSNASDVIFENLTSGARVIANGSAIAALGVTNVSEVWSSATSVSLTEVSNGTTTAGSSWARAGGNGTLAFGGSGLGLVPWTAPSTGAWNDTAPFTATLAATYADATTGSFGNGSGFFPPEDPIGTVAANGSSGLPPIALGLGTVGLANPPVLLCENGPSPAGNGSAYLGPSNCTFAGTGNETAFGQTAGSVAPGYSGNGTGNVTPPPWGGSMGSGSGGMVANLSDGIFLFTDGPYTPGPGLAQVLPGSDLFGGAASAWGPLYAGGYGGYGIGVPGVVGSPADPPPRPTVPSGPPPRDSSAPPSLGNSGDGRFGPVSALASTTGEAALLVALALGTVGAIAVLAGRRKARQGPPRP